MQDMAIGERKYSDEQREAIGFSFDNLGMTARQVVEHAAAGELTSPDGGRVERFDVGENTVRDIAGKERRQRAREAVRGAVGPQEQDGRPLAELPHGEAIESLRRRLLACVEAMVLDFEQQVRRSGKADPERLRSLVRAHKEIAAIPRFSVDRPVRADVDGGPDSAGDLSRAILADVAGEDEDDVPDLDLPVITTDEDDQVDQAVIDSTELSAELRARFAAFELDPSTTH